MLEFFQIVLVKQVSYCVAPILFHASEDSLMRLMCGLLIEFVDSYSTFILLILFVGSLVMFKNLVMKVFSSKNDLQRQTPNFVLLKKNLHTLRQALSKVFF